MEQGRTPKIIKIIKLFEKHEDAVRTRLLEVGLDWDAPRTGRSNWANICATIETDPPWGVLARTIEPETWFWYLPGFEGIQTTKEATLVGNLQRGGEKHKLREFKPAPRPWDEENKKKKLGTKVMPADEAIADFQSRFA